MAKLTNKVAIVTGAAQGIGLGIARVFAAEGAHVILCDVNDTISVAAAAELRGSVGQVVYVHADITVEDDVRRLVAAAMEQFGRLDIVVNNAGIVAVQTVEESSVEEWDRVMAINISAQQAAAVSSMWHRSPALWASRAHRPTAPARVRC